VQAVLGFLIIWLQKPQIHKTFASTTVPEHCETYSHAHNQNLVKSPMLELTKTKSQFSRLRLLDLS
jgi:hypothetical protein